MGYTQYGWSAPRRRTRNTRSVFSFHIFPNIFHVDCCFPPCAQNPVLTASRERQLANGERAREHARESSKRARAPAARPFALRLPSPLPRPDCNRVNIEPGRHMRDEHSPESAFQASATRAGHMAGQPCAAPVRTKSGQSPRTFPHTDTQGHRTGPGQGGATARGVRGQVMTHDKYRPHHGLLHNNKGPYGAVDGGLILNAVDHSSATCRHALPPLSPCVPAALACGYNHERGRLATRIVPSHSHSAQPLPLMMGHY